MAGHESVSSSGSPKEMRRGLLITAAVLAAVLIIIGELSRDAAAAQQEDPPCCESAAQDPVWEDAREGQKIDAALAWHEDSFTVTAYCPCCECCGKDDGITSTGVRAQEGVTIAVDPDVIPIGSWAEINGNLYHAEDVGGAITGNRIDIYFGSHADADAFGTQTKTVRWYE